MVSLGAVRVPTPIVKPLCQRQEVIKAIYTVHYAASSSVTYRWRRKDRRRSIRRSTRAEKGP